jgi:hypothetical protein
MGPTWAIGGGPDYGGSHWGQVRRWGWGSEPRGMGSRDGWLRGGARATSGYCIRDHTHVTTSLLFSFMERAGKCKVTVGDPTGTAP